MKINTTKSKEELIEYINELTNQVEDLKFQNKVYEEQIKQLVLQKFGSSSDKIDINQINLFNEAEDSADETIEEPTIETINYERKKQRSKKHLFEGLPVKTIEYHLDDESCTQCNGKLHVMSTEVTEEIVMIPKQLYVLRHVRDICTCRDCEKHNIKTPVIKAPMPKRAIPGSLASPSLIAHVIDQKYTNGMPLYRQEQDFKRSGIELSRQNLSNWIIKSSEWFKHLYDHMHLQLLNEDILHADETTLQVLHEAGRDATSKSYMWLYRTGKYSQPIVLYDYQETRNGDHPKDFLSGFKGYIHVDGYSGYNKVPNITRVGCLAHARRRFSDCIKVLPQVAKTERTIAGKGFDYCNKLYKIESKIKDLSPEDRFNKRQELSRPTLDAFSAWLQEQSLKILPQSSIGKAISYCINQWPSLINYTLDGRLEIDNNRGERSIKPFVMGRKAFLFSNTPKGATASAIIYSIVETAKENKLKPFEYLTYLLEQLPNSNLNETSELNQFLPWSDTLPDQCKLNK